MIPDNHNHFLMAGSIEPMLAAAVRARLGEVTFAEHVQHFDEARAAIPYLAGLRPEGGPIGHQAYVTTIRDAGAAAGVDARVGIEIDARPEDPGFEAALEAFRAPRESEWDVVVGSVHVTGAGTPFSEPPAVAAD
jgi:histidinol phosphatase-like PHP family hydrolase